MMRELREKTKIVMIVVALAFVGLMVFEWGMDISGTSVASQTGELGRVNGDPVSYEAYNAAYQQLYDQARATTGGAQLSRDQIRRIEDEAFNQVVNELLLQQELRRRDIRVSNEEIIQAAQWIPHPDLMQNELFMTDGQFDISKYQQFLSGPAANEDLLLQLEYYYRTMIPRSKLIRQVTAGQFPSDAELWQYWRDQNELATVDYVPLNVSVLVPGDVEVTDREVRDYYDRNRSLFERPATARVSVAYISKRAPAADSVAALNEALAALAEIDAGASFAEVAQRVSDDPGSAAAGGDLGTFPRGMMTAAFDSAVFALPVGEISEPIATEFGYHIIQVHERTDDQAHASHILIDFEPSDEAMDRLYARADSLEMLAERGGIERAAGAMNAEYRQGVIISEDQPFVPGIGDALEGLEWVQDEQLADDPLEVSPVFETSEAFFIVAPEEYSAPGLIPFSQAQSEARRQLIVEKKLEEARRIGQEMVAEVRGGRSLEEVATARGLSVETVGPFSRTDLNPAFGQANAVIGAAFGVPIGEVSDVVGSPGGLFIIRPAEREEADQEAFERQKEQLRQLMMMQRQQVVLDRWLEELREDANIIDRRDAMLNAPII